MRVAPLRDSAISARLSFPGLTPWAINWRPSGALEFPDSLVTARRGSRSTIPTNFIIPILVFLLLGASPAAAHQIHLFAHAEGTQIEGEVYVRGGQPVREAAVRALSPTGETLAEATTDAQGKFALPARFRCDHRLVVDSGDGHQSSYTLPAAELPESLPAYAASDAPTPPPDAPSKSESVSTPPRNDQLEAIHSQVVQLRKQLDTYEQKTRLHDILGGIGYILGLMGIAGYFLAARRRAG